MRATARGFYFGVVEEIRNMIHMRPKEFTNIRDVSLRTGYSTYHVSRIFRDVMGVSLGKYIKNERLYLAAKLLENSEMSIIAIVVELGFSSQPAFTRSFSRLFSKTPNEWRKCMTKITF